MVIQVFLVSQVTLATVDCLDIQATLEVVLVDGVVTVAIQE